VFAEAARDDRCLTYGGLLRAAGEWTGALGDLGIGTGGTVGVAIADPLGFAASFVGILAAGRTVAPLDPGATDAELAAACARCAPSAVFADRPPPAGLAVPWLTPPSGRSARPGAGPAPRSGLDGAPGTDAMARGSGGVVLTTSGTTGRPKVIRLGAAQLLHTAGCVVSHFGLTAEDRGFNPLPLFHINAEVVGLLATLVSGGTVVLEDRFHRHGFWEAVGRHRATWVNAVPAILARLAVLEDGEDVPGGLRFARSASAPLPVPVLERFEAATGIPVVETYGMTEAASQITANPLRARKPGSAGVPVGTEVRVVMGARSAVPPGEVGRVVIRGPGVISAYASAGYEDRVDADGWLETGDLGYLDEEGYLFLAGRADDVINRGGEKIYPREVEEIVLAEPGVDAVAVVGEEHDVLGRVPVAYLVGAEVRGPGDADTAAELVARVHARCARLLSRQRCPVAYHVVEELPQGATGKVRRVALAGTAVVHSLHP